MKGKSLIDNMVETVGGAVTGYADSSAVMSKMLWRKGGNVEQASKIHKRFLNTRGENLKNNRGYVNGYKMAPMINVGLAGMGAIGMLTD